MTADLTYDITDKDVLWMQKQYRSKFGIELDNEAAMRKLHLLVRQMHVLYQPITRKQAQQVTNANENTSNEPGTPKQLQ
jgi:hypothetical protein